MSAQSLVWLSVDNQTKGHTTVNNTVNIVEICKAFENSNSNLANDLNINRAMLLVDSVQGALVHVFHANMNMRICDKCAVERDDVF